DLGRGVRVAVVHRSADAGAGTRVSPTVARRCARIPRKDSAMISVDLEQLGDMEPRALQSLLDRIDLELGDLHMDGRGELRYLDADEQAEFDRLLNLRNRVYAHLKIRHAAGRGSTYRAFGGSFVRSGVDVDPGEVLRMGPGEVR